MIQSTPLTDCRYANLGNTWESEATSPNILAMPSSVETFGRAMLLPSLRRHGSAGASSSRVMNRSGKLDETCLQRWREAAAEIATQRFGRSLTLPSESSSRGSRRRVSLRRGFTLLELILSLALCAVVAGLIGSLVHIYLINQETGRDSVQQSQMARAILNMIAEDVRTSVRYQSFDTSGLQELLSGATGGGSTGGATTGGSSGGSASGGSSPGGGGTTGSATSGSTSGASTGGASSSGGATDTGSASTTTAGPLPPGIYGSSTSIEIDVSRLPRPDEYYPKVGDTSLGTLGDMPSDVKTVGYYVQSPRTDGVQDSLGQLSQQSASLNAGALIVTNGGLVRRSVDRAVTQYSYEMGQSSQLQRTGELIAPEVLAIEFQYFDGATWQTQWDGSQQGLPHVVKITIAMQRDSKAKSNPLSPGLAISTISTSMIQEYGIEIYSTNTIIPGAQLLVAPQGTTATGSTDTGMSKMGL